VRYQPKPRSLYPLTLAPLTDLTIMHSFTGIDIGSPRLSGKTTPSTDGLEILAGGADIWETCDEFHFAQQSISGDFEMSIRLTALSMADLYTKAGIMLRASLDHDAPHVMLFAFGDNNPRNKNNGGLEFQSRQEIGGSCSALYPSQPLPAEPDFPVNFPHVWLKLSRRSDSFTAQFSPDGEQWKIYGVHHQRLPETAFLGLAVTSHHIDQSVTASFRHVQLVLNP
jgi:hypothetical protein